MQKLRLKEQIIRAVVGTLFAFTLTSFQPTQNQKSLPNAFSPRPVLIDPAEEMIRAKLFEPLKRLRHANLNGKLTRKEETDILSQVANTIREIEGATNGDSLARTVAEQNLTDAQFAKLALNPQ